MPTIRYHELHCQLCDVHVLAYLFFLGPVECKVVSDDSYELAMCHLRLSDAPNLLSRQVFICHPSYGSSPRAALHHSHWRTELSPAECQLRLAALCKLTPTRPANGPTTAHPDISAMRRNILAHGSYCWYPPTADLCLAQQSQCGEPHLAGERMASSLLRTYQCDDRCAMMRRGSEGRGGDGSVIW